MKNLPILLLVLVFVIGCGQVKEQQNQAANVPQNQPAVKVAATALAKAYKENEVAADGQYRDKPLEVSGKITEISETLGVYQVDMEGADLVTVKCDLPESEKSKIAALKKGQNATFTGTGDGMTASLYVGLRDCRIK